jgi:hypothetical protein
MGDTFLTVCLAVRLEGAAHAMEREVYLGRKTAVRCRVSQRDTGNEFAQWLLTILPLQFSDRLLRAVVNTLQISLLSLVNQIAALLAGNLRGYFANLT